MLLASMVSLEEWWRDRLPRVLVDLGASSYSLYLIHPFIVALVWTITSKLNLISISDCVIAFMATIVGSLFCASLAHRFIEVPVTMQLSRYWRTAVPRVLVPGRNG